MNLIQGCFILQTPLKLIFKLLFVCCIFFKIINTLSEAPKAIFWLGCVVAQHTEKKSLTFGLIFHLFFLPLLIRAKDSIQQVPKNQRLFNCFYLSSDLLISVLLPQPLLLCSYHTPSTGVHAPELQGCRVTTDSQRLLNKEPGRPH